MGGTRWNMVDEHGQLAAAGEASAGENNSGPDAVTEVRHTTKKFYIIQRMSWNDFQGHCKGMNMSKPNISAAWKAYKATGILPTAEEETSRFAGTAGQQAVAQTPSSVSAPPPNRRTDSEQSSHQQRPQLSLAQRLFGQRGQVRGSASSTASQGSTAAYHAPSPDPFTQSGPDTPQAGPQGPQPRQPQQPSPQQPEQQAWQPQPHPTHPTGPGAAASGGRGSAPPSPAPPPPGPGPVAPQPPRGPPLQLGSTPTAQLAAAVAAAAAAALASAQASAAYAESCAVAARSALAVDPTAIGQPCRAGGSQHAPPAWGLAPPAHHPPPQGTSPCNTPPTTTCQTTPPMPAASCPPALPTLHPPALLMPWPQGPPPPPAGPQQQLSSSQPQPPDPPRVTITPVSNCSAAAPGQAPAPLPPPAPPTQPCPASTAPSATTLRARLSAAATKAKHALRKAAGKVSEALQRPPPPSPAPSASGPAATLSYPPAPQASCAHSAATTPQGPPHTQLTALHPQQQQQQQLYGPQPQQQQQRWPQSPHPHHPPPPPCPPRPQAEPNRPLAATPCSSAVSTAAAPAPARLPLPCPPWPGQYPQIWPPPHPTHTPTPWPPAPPASHCPPPPPAPAAPLDAPPGEPGPEGSGAKEVAGPVPAAPAPLPPWVAAAAEEVRRDQARQAAEGGAAGQPQHQQEQAGQHCRQRPPTHQHWEGEQSCRRTDTARDPAPTSPPSTHTYLAGPATPSPAPPPPPAPAASQPAPRTSTPHPSPSCRGGPGAAELAAQRLLRLKAGLPEDDTAPGLHPVVAALAACPSLTGPAPCEAAGRQLRVRLRESVPHNHDRLFQDWSGWLEVGQQALTAVRRCVPWQPGVYEWGARPPGAPRSDHSILAFYLGKAGRLGAGREGLRTRFNKYAVGSHAWLGPWQEPDKAAFWWELQRRNFTLHFRWRVCEDEEPVKHEEWLLSQLDYAANYQLNGRRRHLKLPDKRTLLDYPVLVAAEAPAR